MNQTILKSCITLVTMLIVNLTIAQTPVEKHGQLRIEGAQIVDKNGEAVQLKGMSLFWSNWAGEYYNYGALKTMRDEWNCNVIRVPMGINGNDEGAGYLDAPEIEKAKMDSVVKAAIKLGMYVIIDWHSHRAEDQLKEAEAFFALMAKTYGKYPNMLYEPYNEPVKVSWDKVIKPYHEAILKQIRKFDHNNIVICGTPTWSQDVDVATDNPLDDKNVAYTLHYYAATHKQYLRDKAVNAMSKGYAVFVTEFGTCDASGGYPIDAESTKEWFDFLDEHKIGWCNWSIHHKEEAASALKVGVNPNGGWKESDLSESGLIIYNELKKDSE